MTHTEAPDATRFVPFTSPGHGRTFPPIPAGAIVAVRTARSIGIVDSDGEVWTGNTYMSAAEVVGYYLPEPEPIKVGDWVGFATTADADILHQVLGISGDEVWLRLPSDSTRVARLSDLTLVEAAQ